MRRLFDLRVKFVRDMSLGQLAYDVPNAGSLDHPNWGGRAFVVREARILSRSSRFFSMMRRTLRRLSASASTERDDATSTTHAKYCSSSEKDWLQVSQAGTTGN